MIRRISVANIAPLALAESVQAAGLSGTVSASIGAGAWGVEQGATVELAGQETGAIQTWLLGLLRTRHEEAAYVVTNGNCAELWQQDESTVTL